MTVIRTNSTCMLMLVLPLAAVGCGETEHHLLGDQLPQAAPVRRSLRCTAGGVAADAGVRVYRGDVLVGVSFCRRPAARCALTCPEILRFEERWSGHLGSLNLSEARAQWLQDLLRRAPRQYVIRDLVGTNERLLSVGLVDNTDAFWSTRLLPQLEHQGAGGLAVQEYFPDTERFGSLYLAGAIYGDTLSQSATLNLRPAEREELLNETEAILLGRSQGDGTLDQVQPEP